MPADSRATDRWFQHIAIIVSDMDHAYAWLRQHGAQHASPAPQRLPGWNANTGGVRAFYFKDPIGHLLEVLWFPPGTGDGRWQRPTDRPFLGIDHTATVVALVTGDAGAAGRTLRGSACALASPGVIEPAERVLGFSRALLVRDPDGQR